MPAEVQTVRAAGTLDLTVHVRDPDVPAAMRPARGDGSHYRTIMAKPEQPLLSDLAVREWNGHAGATICGKLMRLEELWVPHEPEDRDPVCEPCREGVWIGDDDDGLFDLDDDTPPPRPIHTVRVAGDLL